MPERTRAQETRWGRWLKRTVREQPGRVILIVIGSGVVAAGMAQPVGGNPATFAELGVGGFMVVVACVLPWLKTASITQSGMQFGFQAPASVKASTELATGIDRPLDELERSIEEDFETTEQDTLIGVAQYQAAEAAIHDLLHPKTSPLASCKFHLFLFDALQGLLAPILDEDINDLESWSPGVGVTGVAYATGKYVIAKGEETHNGTYGLTVAQKERYRRLAVVAAMPVLNLSGQPIAVVSGSSEERECGLDSSDGYSEHLSMATAVARVLIDLLHWYQD